MTGDDAQIVYERRRATAQSIAPLRQLVVSFAAQVGATPRQLEDIALAVSEALTNAVQHAYPDDSCRGEMAVCATQHDRMLDILISDDGIGMHPPQSESKRSGHALIAHVTDEFTLSSAPGSGVRARLTFELD